MTPHALTDILKVAAKCPEVVGVAISTNSGTTKITITIENEEKKENEGFHE